MKFGFVIFHLWETFFLIFFIAAHLFASLPHKLLLAAVLVRTRLVQSIVLVHVCHGANHLEVVWFLSHAQPFIHPMVDFTV